MRNFNIILAVCVCWVSFGNDTADAQYAMLYGRTLYLLGSSRGDDLEVAPNSNANGYVVLIDGRFSPISRPGQSSINSVGSGQVDTINIRGYGSSDDIVLGRNFLDENLFDVNSRLVVQINSGNGVDEIDPGVSPFGAKIIVYGGRGPDIFHSYYRLVRGRKVFLSPPLLDYTSDDTIIPHQIGGSGGISLRF